MLRGKIVVVGAGFVGSTTAYTIMLDGFFREIVLIDVNKDKATVTLLIWLTAHLF